MLEQRLVREGRPMTFAQVFAGWQDDAAVRGATLACLRDAPFEALFWELAPLTPARLGEPYRHVLVESPALARVRADRTPFGAHLRIEAPVACFDNLGGDARLIAPTPQAPDAVYAHLARTAREAPEPQLHALLGRVGRETLERLETRAPVWVSTSGLGVFWLHVRLDSRPKYVTHTPYRRPP